MSGTDNGSGGSGGGGGEPAARKPLVTTSVDEYRELLEELDHAWAVMTDTERQELEQETKRRRALNPNWPYITSDHADRLAARIYDNTRAVHLLEDAISGPDGMALRMRASAAAIDMSRDEIARNTEALTLNTATSERAIATSERVIEAVNRLCAALEPRPA